MPALDNSHPTRRRALKVLTGAGVMMIWNANGTQQSIEARSRSWFTDTSLVDQHGDQYRFYTDLLADQPDRVFVIHALFTRCDSACPLVVQQLKTFISGLEAKERDQLSILSISVDPEFDTPARLASFSQKQGVQFPGWRMLTGEPSKVRKVLTRLGLTPPGNEPSSHTAMLIAGRPSRAHWIKLRPSMSTEALRAKIRPLWQ